jgi:hypothetical protein
MVQPSSSPYAAPVVPPTKTSRARLWRLGCGGVLLAALLAVGTCALVVKRGIDAGESTFGPLCERYLSEVAARDYHAAYVALDPGFQATLKEADYVKLEDGIRKQTGAVRTKKIVSLQESANATGQWVNVTYSCEFDTGPGTIRFTFRKGDQGWKIAGFNYDSPKIEESIRSLVENGAGDASAKAPE